MPDEPKRGQLLRPARVTRADLRANPGTLYVFGDNMARRGLGGQAREMRGERNAVGVPTKWEPSMHPDAFFAPRDADLPEVQDRLSRPFDQLVAHIRAGGTVAIPADGLGTGLAELPTRAPRIHAYIEGRIRQLEEIANTPTEESRRGG